MGVMGCGRRILAMAVGVVLMIGGAGVAVASLLRVSVGPLTLVSERLSDANGPCASSGIAYRDSAAEPTITSDPVHPRQLLAAWIAAPGYDRLDQAGADDLVSRSDDGGRHWR